jgi:dimethylglycine dehydrogenase
MVRADFAEPGTSVEIEMFGQRHKAAVEPDEAVWDPQNERMRA